MGEENQFFLISRQFLEIKFSIYRIWTLKHNFIFKDYRLVSKILPIPNCSVDGLCLGNDPEKKRNPRIFCCCRQTTLEKIYLLISFRLKIERLSLHTSNSLIYFLSIFFSCVNKKVWRYLTSVIAEFKDKVEGSTLKRTLTDILHYDVRQVILSTTRHVLLRVLLTVKGIQTKLCNDAIRSVCLYTQIR